jgi:cell division control protein 6
VSDLIGELDMLGIIATNVVSKGRYGRTREVSLAINDNVLERVSGLLTEKLGI